MPFNEINDKSFFSFKIALSAAIRARYFLVSGVEYKDGYMIDWCISDSLLLVLSTNQYDTTQLVFCNTYLWLFSGVVGDLYGTERG